MKNDVVTSHSRLASKFAICCFVVFMTIIVLLHILRPDLDPAWRFISEYEIGPYSWLMQTAFILLGLGTATLGVVIVRLVHDWIGWIGVSLLGISAFGMLLAGVFVPVEGGHLHDLGAMLDMVPFSALLLTWSLLRNPGWVSPKRISWVFATIPLIGFVIFMVSMVILLPQNGGRPGPTVLVGWQNRFLIFTQCLWMIYLARQIIIGAIDLKPPAASNQSAEDRHATPNWPEQ